MPIAVSIEEATFSDGTSVAFQPNSVVAIVGPNNAGKSLALSDLATLAGKRHQQLLVVRDLKLAKQGSEPEFEAWLAAHATQRDAPHGRMYSAPGGNVGHSDAIHRWGSLIPDRLGALGPFLVTRITATERLKATEPAPVRPKLDGPLTHPIHFLQRDEEAERRVSGLFRQAFGEDLIVNHGAGAHIPLHVGTRPELTHGDDRLSSSFLSQLSKLPLLNKQGDGTRSFAGVLLEATAGDRHILLVDEPEAFLHPPQARLLGEFLVTQRPADRQLFLATHSGDVLRGLLDAGSERLMVLRLHRRENVNNVAVLKTEDIKQLWSDTLLRHSNILEGVFHESVVICESDSDCRFYSALMSAMLEDPQNKARRPDVMFAHCGTKDRTPMALRALRALRVPVHVIVDFDVLHGENPLRGLVEFADGNWEEISSDWSVVNGAVDKLRPKLDIDAAKAALQKAVEQLDRDSLNKVQREIREILGKASAWGTVKRQGKAAIQNGEEYNALERLLRKLASLGIHVVPVGELENFCRPIGGHGPKWVNEVLGRRLATDQDLKEAREFLKSLRLWEDPAAVPAQ